MKALSIKQPWASLIAHGVKDIENRTWKTHFRGKIYIHSSAKSAGKMKELLTPEQYDFLLKSGWKSGTNKPISAIIGEVEIVDCVINHESIWADKTQFREEDDFMDESDERNYYENVLPNIKPIYNWVLANPVLYEKPILNVKGKLSFWEPDIDIVECIGCNGKFNQEEMKQDESEENFCSECWNELSPVMIQETKECEARDKLAQFGKVVTVKQSDNDFEFLITDGFSQKAINTFSCMEECHNIAGDYPNVKKCVTEDNMFHLILTKDKK